MYPNLKAEMARKDVSVLKLSMMTGIPYATLAPKLRGDKRLYLDEAVKIMSALATKEDIETLFAARTAV